MLTRFTPSQPTTAPDSGNPFKSTEAALVCVLRSASYTRFPLLLMLRFIQTPETVNKWCFGGLPTCV
ncbi:MAG: hypothetical protein ACO3OB_03770, partial [bacterium]